MKTVFRFGMALGVAALLFGSCQKIQTTEQEMQLDQTATITIQLGALNNAVDAAKHPTKALPAPKGNLILSTDAEALGGAKGKMYIMRVNLNSTSVNVNVPVVEEGVAYALTFEDYADNYTFEKQKLNDKGIPEVDGKGNPVMVSVTEKRIYTCTVTKPSSFSGKTELLKPGQKIIMQAKYTAGVVAEVRP